MVVLSKKSARQAATVPIYRVAHVIHVPELKRANVAPIMMNASIYGT
jgi:hypothetical protein